MAKKLYCHADILFVEFGNLLRFTIISYFSQPTQIDTSLAVFVIFSRFGRFTTRKILLVNYTTDFYIHRNIIENNMLRHNKNNDTMNSAFK